MPSDEHDAPRSKRRRGRRRGDDGDGDQDFWGRGGDDDAASWWESPGAGGGAGPARREPPARPATGRPGPAEGPPRPRRTAPAGRPAPSGRPAPDAGGRGPLRPPAAPAPGPTRGPAGRAAGVGAGGRGPAAAQRSPDDFGDGGAAAARRQAPAAGTAGRGWPAAGGGGAVPPSGAERAVPPSGAERAGRRPPAGPARGAPYGRAERAGGYVAGPAAAAAGPWAQPYDDGHPGVAAPGGPGRGPYPPSRGGARNGPPYAGGPGAAYPGPTGRAGYATDADTAAYPGMGGYPGADTGGYPAQGYDDGGGYGGYPDEHGELGYEEPPPRRLRAVDGWAAAGPGDSSYRGGVRTGQGAVGDDDYDDYDDYDEDDDEFHDEFQDEDEVDGGGKRRRGARITLIILLVLLLAAGGSAFLGWSWLQDQIDPPGGQGETVSVEIGEGTSTADIGKGLEDAGVIANAQVWAWYTRFNDPGTIQAGTFDMKRNSSMGQAIAVLKEGPAAQIGTYVTIPEGYTVAQTVARVADPERGIEGFTADKVQASIDSGAHKSAYLPPDQASPEGTLYPETYRLEEDQDEDALVGQMVAQFDKVMGELDANGRAAALGRTPYEVLIVASMVEKEAQVPEERGQVARVIYNRLEEDMALGIDATSCYAKGETPCTLTASDLGSDSPYNTRNRKGLPPTPIASPGRASIEAALNPTPGDWRFYVLSDSEGHHTFAVTDDEFEAARQVCIERDLGCGG